MRVVIVCDCVVVTGEGLKAPSDVVAALVLLLTPILQTLWWWGGGDECFWGLLGLGGWGGGLRSGMFAKKEPARQAASPFLHGASGRGGGGGWRRSGHQLQRAGVLSGRQALGGPVPKWGHHHRRIMSGHPPPPVLQVLSPPPSLPTQGVGTQ